MTTQRTISDIRTATPNSVGDGFIGLNAFHPQGSRPFSPFLLLDHHGPMKVKPSEYPKGVDQHPHRGFETVTIVYEGALEHRDSAGNHGKLFAGDVQWMTAAAGIIHEEKHERAFSRQGGQLDFVQLWVNLPARYKMNPPRYQDIAASTITTATLPGGGQLRVIAGELAGLQGPASTFSPVVVADLSLNQGQTEIVTIPESYALMVYVLSGSATLNSTPIDRGQIALLNQDGDSISLSAAEKTKLLILAGEPIREPLAVYGPFVMNTREEILEAFEDFQAGRMGVL
ncbi:MULTISPECIES: pirin family protein [unclassified Spirosoma]|uniref:pirin family protein n=1 Tax=unclassified Spirosoma TaxID=2621999 RepID=UPI000968B5AB|nr:MULTISPECIES: pirin family protein [unclassified Spirosoma]MBN8825031.1 pirin family protein [Spirosoma sp.]OJW73325.1 MAG: short-chain dehydrogenase [Spirosoma sp. 48-14]